MEIPIKKWVFSKRFQGKASEDNFKLVEEKLTPNIRAGEIFTEAEFISVDPYLRVEQLTEVDDESRKGTILGTQVAKVLESKSKTFPAGSYVSGELGWRTHTICSENEVETIPEIGELPRSSAMGIYGMTGMTAYFGIKDVLDPKPGEVVLVSAAAGSVGSIAGQIAKIKGCKVIGSAGSQAKCDWLTKELGFDYAFNYKSTSLEDALKSYASSGIDCCFDNVGGKFTLTVVRHINPRGRILCCGSISTYNDGGNQPEGPYPWYYICQKSMRIEGMDIREVTKERCQQAREQMAQWVLEGKLKYREHITTGFEHIPTAFLELFQGKNIGKAVVKV